MAQVVTNENMLEFIEKRQVPEFKAPDAKDEPAKPSEPEVKPEAKRDEPAKVDPVRGPDGKFVKADEQAAKPEDTAAKAADDDDHDDDGAKLSDAVKRKIDRIVAKKHRAMKEAEEFGREEYRERKAAVERAEALQRELDALKAGKSGAGPASEGDEPKPEDFKTVGEYTRALTKYEVAQAKKTEKAADSAEKAKQTQQQQMQAATARLSERVAEFAKATPDYAQVMEAADWDVPPHMQAYFVDSENPGLLGYHLAKHEVEFDRIAKLSPIRAFAELGKLEDKLIAKPAEPKKEPAPAATQVSRAPAPITPLEGKSTTVTKDPATMTFQELRAHRQAERAAGKTR